MQIRKTRAGVVLAVLAGGIFGTSGIFTRAISGVTPLGIAAIRLLLAFLFMAFLLWHQKAFDELRRSTRHYPLLILLGVISSFHFLCFVIAVQKTFIANALILVNTAPILVLLLAPIFLKEAITHLDLLSVAMTFLGAGAIVGFDQMMLTPDHLLGDLCALGSALCYAFYVILARRLRQTYSSLIILFWFFGLGGLFLLSGGLWSGDAFFFAPTPSSFIFLGFLGVLPTGIGHFSYNLSLKYIPAAKASTMILLEPVTGTVFAALFLQEIPPLSSLLGIGIALFGIGMASVSHLRHGIVE
ncbi:hypothetical protein CSA56_06430 [candidate division KSB3 bacterium]|uniref:EamA domain-containing protein n=1 Tax=candidate division KSB3 bacterium TaxID=2044937 RepID=A0A2G6KHP0_9BACT|nr:MAG: hypothetical protein CSA56_06430 [candidate division KSB3 bacterium]